LAFLIDASETMLQPADPATQPPDWDESLPWRAIDLALHLTQTTMRSKCVRRRGAGARARAWRGRCALTWASARPWARRIVCNENDLMSVTFFGSVRRARVRRQPARADAGSLAAARKLQREKQGVLNCDFAHVYTLQEAPELPAMDVPTARRIQALTHLPGALLLALARGPSLESARSRPRPRRSKL
jgi:hypothetical protein